MKKAVFLMLSLSTLLWVSCGGGGGGGGNPPPPPVTISISPTTSSVGISATVQFTATVRNTTNTAVTWQVNDIAGGNGTVGTIGASGLYTAPASIAASTTVTVKAISQADATKSASATVTLLPVEVSVSPPTSTVTIGGTVQFTATVQNTSNTAVTWQVNDITGGNGTVGTISASGLYTASANVPSPATVTVKAVSQADTTKSGSATVTITLTIAVNPATATVPAGGTQQFTATVQGVANTAVTWQVNGVAGGNASVGTISAAGLYTAPLAIPAGGSVTVTAIAQADASRTDTAAVTVTHSNAMLSGRYAFSYTAYNPNLYFIAGSFIADGAGVIPSGTADLNSYDVFPALTVSGTYAVEADGQVDIQLTDSLFNTYTLHAVVISPGHLRVIQFDSAVTLPPAGAYGQGVIDKQDPAAFNDAAFAGGYAFRFDGYGFASCNVGIAGRMTADGAGNLTGGIMDMNECGVSTNSLAFTGTYGIDANGRGEAFLDTPAGPATFAFYIVSSDKIHLVSLDYYPWMLGAAEKQTLGTFSNANLTGDYAYFISGYSTTGIYYSAGRFTANGSGAASSGVADENDGGVTTENLAFTGTYAVEANGRGSGSFTSTRGTTDFNFYMVSPSRALFVQLGDFALGTGEVDAQTSGAFSNASFAGNYGFSMDGYPSMLVGVLDAAGGAASGTVDINIFDEVNSVFVPSPDEAFTATYSVTANGRGNYAVADVSGPITFHIYMISGSKAHLIGISDIFLGAAEKRY